MYKLLFPVRATKALAVARKQRYRNFIVCMFMNTIIELIYQKLTKNIVRSRSIQGICMRGKTYARIWGLKREEGVCSKGPCFRELTV